MKKSRRSIDVKKLLFTKPSGLFEQFSYIIILASSFSIYFGPLVFSEIEPLKALLFAIIPSIFISWPVFSIVRLVYNKSKYTL